MDQMEFLGYLVCAIITLGSFVAVVMKFTKPINDLLVAIQKLNDNIDSIKKDNDIQNSRITKHGEQIDNLNNRVGTIETKVERIEHQHVQ